MYRNRSLDFTNIIVFATKLFLIMTQWHIQNKLFWSEIYFIFQILFWIKYDWNIPRVWRVLRLVTWLWSTEYCQSQGNKLPGNSGSIRQTHKDPPKCFSLCRILVSHFIAQFFVRSFFCQLINDKSYVQIGREDICEKRCEDICEKRCEDICEKILKTCFLVTTCI